MIGAAPPSCHAASTHRAVPEGSAVVAFVGAPNVGKSTLVNALTGARLMVGNWPGTSVEIGRGPWELADRSLDAIDFPGAYSLDPLSPDEELTRALLVDAPEEERPDVIVVVADASALARSLYIAAQVRELPSRVVVALTMGDVAARRGEEPAADVLAEHLGCAVVPIDPRRRTGIAELERAVADALALPAPAPRTVSAAVDGSPMLGTDLLDDPLFDDPMLAAADERFAWIDAAVSAAVEEGAPSGPSPSERIDRVLLHPLAGPLIFLGVMWCVFQLTTTVAAPLQDALDALFSGPVSDAASALLSAVHLDIPIVRGLVIDGLIAGVGTVLTFAPLMAIMFALLALLEDSGYMARAAVVADRLMRAIGLPGKAFLPIIVGFGCNVPAISATRILGSARQRLVTALLIPFTSCSARLTVYVMLASTFFPAHAGSVVFAMYVVSILLVVVVGLVLRGAVRERMGSTALVLDLPTYQVPTLRLIGQVTWLRLRGFLQTAGGIIVATVVAVWLLQAIPVTGSHAFGDVPPADSAYAALAGALVPLFAPAGFGDWRAVGALVTGFLAKEAVISSWAQTYAVADPSDAAPGAQAGSDLAARLHTTFESASGGHPHLAVVAFMLFLLAYTPCVATIAAQKREIGLRWTLGGVALQLGIAYVLAVAVFQIGSLVG